MGDEKLQSFHKSLLANPNIKGIPTDYAKFTTVFDDPAKGESFYKSLKESQFIKGLPESYAEFVNGLAIKTGGIEAPQPTQTNPELEAQKAEWKDKNFLEKYITGIKKGFVETKSAGQNLAADIFASGAKAGEVVSHGQPEASLGIASVFAPKEKKHQIEKEWFPEEISIREAYHNALTDSVYQDLKAKAETTRQKAEGIYTKGIWAGLGQWTPLIAGSIAATATAELTGGASLSAIPGLIGTTTTAYITTDVAGKAIQNYDNYAQQKDAFYKAHPEQDNRSDVMKFLQDPNNDMVRYGIGLLSAAIVKKAGDLMKFSGEAIRKTAQSLIGDAAGKVLSDNPQVASDMFQKWASQSPNAMKYIKQMARETGKSGAVMGSMTILQDFIDNVYRDPKDRKDLETIAKETGQSVLNGLALGIILGPSNIYREEMYNRMRQNKNGVTIVQDKNGNVYERLGIDPKNKENLLVINSKGKQTLIKAADVKDIVNLTKQESDTYLDAWKKHQDNLPELENQLRQHSVKRSLIDLTDKIVYVEPGMTRVPEGEQGRKLSTATGLEQAPPEGEQPKVIVWQDAKGETYFERASAHGQDGVYSIMAKIEPNADGTFKVRYSKAKTADTNLNPVEGWQKIDKMTADQFVNMEVNRYIRQTTGQPEQQPSAETPQAPITQEEQDVEQIRTMGQKLRFNGTDDIVFAQDGEMEPEQQPLVILSERDEPLTGKKVAIAVDLNELRAAKWDIKKIDPKFMSGDQLKQRKYVPHQQWIDDELNNYYTIKQQSDTMTAQMEAPVEEGETITLGDKMFNVTAVGPEGVQLNEIAPAGNITKATLNVTPDQYTKVFGQPAPIKETEAVQPEVVPGTTVAQPEAAQAEPEPQLPMNKQGEIEYEKIQDPKVYAYGLTQEFGEEASTVLDELIAEKTDALAKAKKTSDAIQRARKTKALNAEITRLNEVKSILKPQINDQKNITGLPGEVREGQEPVQAKPVEETGRKETPSSGVLQAQEQVTEQKQPVVEKTTAQQPSTPDETAPVESEMQKAGEVVSEEKKKIAPVAQMLDMPVSEINAEWDEGTTYVDNKIKKIEPKIKELRNKLKNLKGKGIKEKRAELQEKIKGFVDQTAKLKGELDNEHLERWLEFREWMINEVKSRGIQFNEDEDYDFLDEVTSAITERPGVEWTWNLTVRKVFEDTLDAWVKNGSLKQTKSSELTKSGVLQAQEQVTEQKQPVVEKTTAQLIQANNEVEPKPTEAQKEAGIEKARQIVREIRSLEKPEPYLRDLTLPQWVFSFFNSLRKSNESRDTWSVYGKGFVPYNAYKIKNFFFYVDDAGNGMPGRTTNQSADILGEMGFDLNLVEKAEHEKIWFKNGVFLCLSTGDFKSNFDHFYSGTLISLQGVIEKQLMNLVDNGVITEQRAGEIEREEVEKKEDETQEEHEPEHRDAKGTIIKIGDYVMYGHDPREAGWGNAIDMIKDNAAQVTGFKNLSGLWYPILKHRAGKYKKGYEPSSSPVNKYVVIPDFEDINKSKEDTKAREVTPEKPAEQKPQFAGEFLNQKQESPWQMTRDEYISSIVENSKLKGYDLNDLVNRSSVQHKQIIEKALAEGKPVPPEVLADYPELAQSVQKSPESQLIQANNEVEPKPTEAQKEAGNNIKTKAANEPGAKTTSKEAAGRADQPSVPAAEQTTHASDKGAQEAVSQERKATFGADNKIFTADAAQRARERMRRKLGELHFGIDPEMMQDGITLAGFYIEGGAKKFTEYAGKMIADFGDAIKPYLKSFYNAVRDWPEFDTEGMTDYDEVRNTDLNKLGKEEKPEDFIKHHIIFASMPKAEPIQKKGGNEINPREGWRDNLIKAREYAEDLIPFERREIMRNEGDLDWNDKDSIVKAIDQYLKTQENGPKQERQSIEAIENKAEAIEREAKNVTDREQAGRIIEETDGQIEEIDSQLKLIGKYTIPEDYYRSHEYPHLGLESILKKELTKYSKELVRVLGWEHDTDKKGKTVYASINLAPAGGDGTIYLWKPGSNLGVFIDVAYQPTYADVGDYTEEWAVKSIMGEGQEIMWRLNTKEKKYSGMQNHFVPGNTTAGELAMLINKAISTYEESDNKRKFEYPQLNYENNNANQTVPNRPGESTSPMDGGILPQFSGGPVRSTETSGVSGQKGAVGRTANTTVAKSRNAEAIRGGSSNRNNAGTSEGLRTGMVGGTSEEDTGDRGQPGDINSKNHVIGPDDVVVPKGDISKIRANIAAIELLNKLEKANRNATPEEKAVLSKYVGWGGLATVLDENKARYRQFEHEWDNKYGSYYDKIRKILSDEEYRTAVNSTINAHYTSIPIIRQLWSMAKHLGFQGGKALEPAGGIGHFIGAMPESLGKSTTFTAYELDSISGRILTKLYPQASVHVTGYEESKLAPASQDLIITNVPFGKTAPFDIKNKELSKFSLHNYFIAKGITQLKPGGIGIFITSSSTMDVAASMKFREWAVNEGNSDLVGAIRLPNNAFKENAGTEVTTDILVFRKRTSDLPSEYAHNFRITKSIGQAKTSNGETVDLDVNQYFADHPENILGKMMLAHEAGSGGLYTGDSQTAAPIKGMNLDEAIAERIAAMPTGIMNTEGSSAVLPSKKAESGDKDGTLVHKDGVIYEVSDGELIPTEWTGKDISIKGKKYKASQIAQEYLGIKAAVNNLLDLEQSETSTDEEIAKARKELNTLYDAFVDKYKTINKNKTLEFLEDDSEYNMVNGLEDIEVEMKPNKAGRLYATYKISKAPIFSQRVNFPSLEPKQAATLEDAYNISLSYRNTLDLEYMSNLLGTTVDKLTQELINEGFAFKNPKTGLIEDKDAYLSGYVKTKYKEAVEAAKDNPEFQHNVDALLPTLPKDIPGQLIGFRLGSSWIPPEIVSAYIEEKTGLNVKAQWVPGVEKWVVNHSRFLYHAKNNTSGAGGMTGLELITHALQLSRPTVKSDSWEDGKKVKRIDREATAAAIGKMEELMDEFVSFVRNNPDYMAQCEKIYNDQYNNFIEKKFSLPTFKHYPTANKNILLYEHQRKAITRSLKESTLLAHQVGTGKTFTMITAAMEMRRLGIAKKPMIVVQNGTIEQFAKSFRELYPSAKLLVAGKNDSKPDKRQKVFNRIAYGDWDAIIIPQSFLKFIPDDPARERAYIEERIAELQEIKDSADDESWNNPIVSATKDAIKNLEKQLEKKKTQKVKDVAKANLAVEKKVKSQLGRRRDDVRTFEKMGVDAMFVDEAHAYKKLGFATTMSRVRGIDAKGSQRALSLMMKVRFIQEKMNGRNVILATGTPISNTMAEVWTMMNYISPEVLKEYHIETFDKFASTYGKIEPSLEFTAAGKFKTIDRFKSYNNAPELSLAFRAIADIVLTEDVKEFKVKNTVPKLKNGQFTQIILPQTTGITNMMVRFKKIMEDWERLTWKEKMAKRHIPLVVFGRAKQAAIDLRLLSPAFPDEPGSKTNAVVKEVKRIYDATSSYNGTQLIFSDMYQSPDVPGEQRFNLYEEIKRKLVNLGIPAKEIEIISNQADNKREEIFNKINEGEIRILMGSTEKLGTGVNVQELLAGLHHVDAPPRPMDFEQRNGRIIRQGNTHAAMNLPIEIVTYGVEKTLDATAYQRLAIKQKFINQMMKGEGLDREVADSAEEDLPTDMTFDHMMATLSGSQTAILYTFKQGELRKLQTAKQSFERNLIDTKTNLNLEKSALARAQYRLVLAEKADKLLNEKFAGANEKSLVLNIKGKSIDINKQAKDIYKKEAVENLKKRRTPDKIAMELLGTYLDKIKKDTLATETTPDEWEGSNSKRAVENQLNISVNGFDGFIRYNPRSLVDVNASQFMYAIEISEDLYKDITSGFTSAAGFIKSVEAQTAKIMESLVSSEKAAIENHEKQIPIYEIALNKTFDKEEKLRKVQEEVKELEEKMKQESEIKTPPAPSGENSELEAVEYEEENTGEEEKEIPENNISLLNETAEEYLNESKDGYASQAKRKEAIDNAISAAERFLLYIRRGFRGSVYPKVKKRTVLKGFKESKKVDFVGQKIDGPQDIADLWSIHRSPYIEKTHLIFLKDGVILGSTAYTLNRAGVTSFPKPEVVAELSRKFGADTVYLLHNHPSGKHRPSRNDVATTMTFHRDLSAEGINLAGHVIIDTTKFSFIDLNQRPVGENVKYMNELDTYIDNDVFEFEYKNAVPKLFSERESLIDPDRKEATFEKIFAVSKALLTENNYKGAIIYLSSNMEVAAYDVFPRNAKPEDIILKAYDGLEQSLGRQVVFVHDGSFKDLVKQTLPSDTLDVIDISTASNQWFIKAKGDTYDESNLEGIWEEQSPYKKQYEFATDYLVNEPQTPLARGAQAYAEKKAAREGKEVLQGIREYIQDMNLPIRKFEEEVLKRGGKQDNNSKPYRDSSLSFGRQEKLYNDFVEKKMKPVIKVVADITKKSGIEGGEILPYIISKHAIERNAVMRGEEIREWTESHPDASFDEIEAKREEVKDKDYAGVMAFDLDKNGTPSGNYTNPDDLARDIVDEFEGKVDRTLVDDLWSKIKEASSATLDTWVASNQISDKQRQEYYEKFRYFVPLRGWRHDAAKELTYTKGGGFSRSLKHAEGRKSLADNPLAYMQQVQFQAIGEQVDNEVKTSMLNLIIRNLGNNEINDLATIKKLYYVKVHLPDGSYEWEPTTTRPAPELFESGDAQAKIYREHERLRKPIQAMEHEVWVKKPGGDMVIVFKNKNLKVAQALNKQNYMYRSVLGHIFPMLPVESDVRKDIHNAFTWMSPLNNTLKALYTSWNVVFPFTNFMRDFQEASITQSIKMGKGIKVMTGYSGAFPAIYRRMMGSPDFTKKIDRDLEEFYNLGGATGFTHNKTIEEIEKEFEKDLKRMVNHGTIAGNFAGSARKIFRGIEAWNMIFEDATRFSVYLSSIAAGNSKQDAAYDAKEASVNFNRKGKGSKAWDAYFAFFNVAIQSLQKNFKLAKDYPAKFATVATSFTMLGFLEAMMNALTDDDDDDKSYYNLNPYMRQNYLVIPLPGLGGGKADKYLSVPLPQFWRGFKSVGAIAFDIATKKMTVKEGITDALGNFGSALLPVDIGGFYNSGEFSFAPIAPTVLKPVAEVLENKNYMGYSIMNEPFTREQNKMLAAAGLGKANVSPATKFFTDLLFRWGGGEGKYKYYYDKNQNKQKVPWIMDINPSGVEHIFKGYTGGSGGVFSDLITTIKQAGDPDENIDFRNVPFVNRFIRKTPEAKWNIIREYYDNRDDKRIGVFLQKDLEKRAEESGDWSKVEKIYSNQYIQEYHEIFRMYEAELDDAAKDKSFDLVEGSKRAIDLMEQCNRDIAKLKERYKK